MKYNLFVRDGRAICPLCSGLVRKQNLEIPYREHSKRHDVEGLVKNGDADNIWNREPGRRFSVSFVCNDCHAVFDAECVGYPEDGCLVVEHRSVSIDVPVDEVPILGQNDFGRRMF